MKFDKSFLTTALLVILGGYLVFYISSYDAMKESFQQLATVSTVVTPADRSVSRGDASVTVGETKEVSLTAVEVPYTQTPINEVGDYDEVNMVYQNEADTPLSKALRDKLMSQRPMDWSGYPPSSSQFQAGLRESFENAKPTVPDDPKPFENVSGDLMQPPDMSELERKERAILQTYKPKFPPTPTTYDSRDANEIIKQIYDLKGVIPDVRHKEGTNVYEIVGVRRKDEKVMFEDEAEAMPGANKDAMESTTKGPQAARDAFFDSGSGAVQTKERSNKWNYTSWTPGLERMFAPTEPQQQWY